MSDFFEEDLFTFLSGGGMSAGSRIYPNTLPQNATLPALRYFQVSDPPEHTQNGRSSLRHPRYQFECFADSYLEAKRLALQLVALADGYRGAMGDTTCYAGFSEDLRDNHDPETGRHWVSVDLEIWHRAV